MGILARNRKGNRIMAISQEALVDKLLAEMFRRVGKDYERDKDWAASTPDWYTTHKWAFDEEEDFRQWALKTVRRHRPSWGKRMIDREVAFFLLQWGWSIDLDSIEDPA